MTADRPGTGTGQQQDMCRAGTCGAPCEHGFERPHCTRCRGLWHHDRGCPILAAAPAPSIGDWRDPQVQDAASLDYAENALSETWSALRRIAAGEPDPRRIATDMLEAHGHVLAAAPAPDSEPCFRGADEYGRPYCAAHGRSWPCPDSEAAPQPDGLREAIADELGRHADMMRPTPDDDRVHLGCRCGHQRATVTAAELAAHYVELLRQHRLHVADALLTLPAIRHLLDTLDAR